MAARKNKTITTALPLAPRAPVPLTIEALKPRNRLATHPLLKKSSVHTDARQRRAREALLDE
jgi:hypothetical protein